LRPVAPAVVPGNQAGSLRLAFPFVLVLLEYLALSLWLDLPTEGPAVAAADALRIAFPVVLGAIIAGYLVSLHGTGSERLRLQPLPDFRPIPAAMLHSLAFAGTALLAGHLLEPGRPPLGPGALAILGVSAGTTALLALAITAPLSWWLGALRRWRGVFLSLALGGLVWRAAAAAEDLWGYLSSSTIRATAWLLGPFGTVTVERSQAVLGLNGFEVQIAPVCSGASGIGLVVTFLVVWIALARDRLRVERALLVVPIGAALAVVLNVLRIASLVLAGSLGAEALAIGGFHSKLGWVLFGGLSLGLLAVVERVAWFSRSGRELYGATPEAPDTSWLAPLLASLATALLAGVFVSGTLDLWYAARIVAPLAVLAAVRERLPPLVPTRSALPALVGVVIGLAWAVLVVRRDELFPALAALPASARVAWILARVVGSVLVIPLVEELAFRGFLLRWLTQAPVDEPSRSLRNWPWASILVSSVAFGGIHSAWVAGFASGLVFAAVRLWRGRLGDAVVAHAAANAVLALAVVLGGRWDLW